jgi:hypothetical protein
MTRPDTQQAEAVALLRRDARAGKTGAAAAYSRELRRRDREGQIVTKREIQAEHQRKMSTSRYDLEDGTTAELAGLNTKLFDEHNKNGACRCAAVCLPHAEAVLRSLLLSDEDFHALYENERQSDG